LLSGKFKESKLGKAYFIDRNGSLFEPILDYLRTGELNVPQNISIRLLRREAEYYSLQSLVSLLEQEEKLMNEKPISKIRFDGCYALESKGSFSMAISFLEDRKQIVIGSGEAVNNLRVFHKSSNPIPKLWSNSSLEYATWVQNFIKRGIYIEDAEQPFALKLKLSQFREPVLAMVADAGNLLYIMDANLGSEYDIPAPYATNKNNFQLFKFIAWS